MSSEDNPDPPPSVANGEKEEESKDKSPSRRTMKVIPANTESIPLQDMEKAKGLVAGEVTSSKKTVRASESYEDAIERPSSAEVEVKGGK